MNLVVYTLSVRGAGNTTAKAKENADRRLNAATQEIIRGELPVAEGTDLMVREPGGGGPCAPEYIDFPVLIFAGDLPEAQKKPKDD